ncbi:MAG: hypothetical protein ACHQNT_04040, partial [Bacteroidia bacterium]
VLDFNLFSNKYCGSTTTSNLRPFLFTWILVRSAAFVLAEFPPPDSSGSEGLCSFEVVTIYFSITRPASLKTTCLSLKVHPQTQKTSCEMQNTLPGKRESVP